ncbi:MAG: TonB-dependent receptor [Bacteroidia bacterium]
MRIKKILLVSCFLPLVSQVCSAQTDSTVVPQKKSTEDTTTTARSLNNAEHDTVNNVNGVLPIFSTGSSGMSGNNLQSQDVTSLLGSSRDIFMQANAMHFLTARFRYRGYNSNNMTIMMNGVRLNSLENGTAGWSTWGGMNDVIRFMDMKTGLGSSRSTFGDVGGYFNLNVFASTFRKGLRVTYSEGNRIFKQRVTATYSTGILKSGWAFSVSGSARYAAKGYVPGTSFQGFGLFLGADKKLSENNTLSLVLFGAPITQARQSYETDEAYSLVGDKHYNSFWGLQNGQVRSAKISKTNVPTMILTDLWNINDHSKLTVSGFASVGRTSLTGLNFSSGVPYPAPDFYGNMPSYYAPSSSDANPTQFANLTNAWQNNTANPQSGWNTAQQIDWNSMYQINANNLQTVPNVDGVAGATHTGRRSAYIVEEQRQDITTAGFNAIYNTKLKNDIYITGGLNGTISNTRYYKVVNDLLGGDYWLDQDQYVNSLSPNPMVIQNNINDPNKIIKTGDVFGYDYNINVNRFELWGQAEKSINKFDMYLSVTANNTSFYRAGHMVNGLFPSSSGGDGSSGGNSKTLDFLNYGVKAGVTYKIDGHNYITINAAYITKPPLPSSSFVSPRTRNDEVTGIGSEKILTGDITYNVRLPWLKGRITYYYTQINNQAWQRSYFDDVYKTYVNYFMTNLNQLNQGIELGLEGIVTKRVSIIGALGYGSYLYTNRPTATISADNTAALLATDRTVYFQNYHVGGAPEVASSLGVRYTGKQYWYAGVYVNYFANNYVTANPDRRTKQDVAKYVSTDPQVNQILTQEKLPNAYTIDFMGGKAFRLNNKNGINVTLMVNNLTNNIFKTSGQEQLRHDANNILKFPNRYLYSFGLTFMASVAFVFN